MSQFPYLHEVADGATIFKKVKECLEAEYKENFSEMGLVCLAEYVAIIYISKKAPPINPTHLESLYNSLGIDDIARSQVLYGLFGSLRLKFSVVEGIYDNHKHIKKIARRTKKEANLLASRCRVI